MTAAFAGLNAPWDAVEVAFAVFLGCCLLFSGFVVVHTLVTRR